MASTLEQEPEYIVEKAVPDNSGLHFVRRVIDGDRYLAVDYDRRDFPELSKLREPKADEHGSRDFPDRSKVREPKPDDKIVAFEAAARVLNHENLISVAKPMPELVALGHNRRTHGPFSLVYEYCADGNLQQLFDQPPMEVTDQGFLPEGLVWHVALSMLRAFTFLHEGWREKVMLSKDDIVIRTWYRPDDDWMPILHRSVRPENVHFQARKGKETYGLCKLGDFGRCIVAGTARVATEDNHIEVLAVVDESAEQRLSQEEIRSMWYLAYQDGAPNWANTKQHGRVYTIGSELADLGAILYRMMTCKTIEVDLCQCGCFHINPALPGCQCSCSLGDVYLDNVQLGSKYSDGLREVVIGLIRLNRENSARAYTCFEKAWPLYRRWRQTAAGGSHFDHYDDLVARKRAERSHKLELEGKRELGVEEVARWEQAGTKMDENLLVWG